ncbi:transposase-like protein [Actinoplanes campanulatus]|uniref:Transposase-like protein n=1 Tax=Actinoplanes campanulatus TaxID=113559 RepID=A0A7W5FJ74_9ACTN|nr:hypothetical protein [Actinoplanes campanulatus]MBB3100302.1 transposase-like protein [Actinoplanes campanulatus]GGN43976.1 hypothetical protein GCM10010109_76680 [Actinoplanes campanulatus]GID40896.1 hypothetical protein Aca09nite_74020 [Actinoplanes campanulatus]
MLYWQLSDGHRHYDLTATADRETLTVEVTGADSDGRIIAHLNGTIPRADLTVLARLLAAAADPGAQPQSMRTPPVQRGRSWSAEETVLVTRLHRDGAEVEDIAASLGRTANSIRYKLHALGLGPRPGPKQPPAYTMDDLRQEHPNSHRRWTPEEEQRLARRAAEGATVPELMAEFGRNENGITARLARLEQRP